MKFRNLIHEYCLTLTSQLTNKLNQTLVSRIGFNVGNLLADELLDSFCILLQAKLHSFITWGEAICLFQVLDIKNTAGPMLPR